AARAGILVKDAASLERAAGVTCVLFDKTGTLTEGKPHVVEIRPLPGVEVREVLRLAGSLEAESPHPLAEGVVRRAREEGVALATPSEFRSYPGRGVAGRVEGKRVVVGSVG